MRGVGFTSLLLVLASCGARSALPQRESDGGCGSPTGQCADGWCSISAGCFAIGDSSAPPCSASEVKTSPAAHVKLTHGFEIGQYEVTQAEFKSVMGYDPVALADDRHGMKKRDCPSCPVYWVTWSAAVAYCNALSAGKQLPSCYPDSEARIYECRGYRLPTEAEWELAYRAGTDTAYYNGAMSSCFSDPNAAAIGWYLFNAQLDGSAPDVPHERGTKAANRWGLHDMAGNVDELVHDRWTTRTPDADLVDPQGGPVENKLGSFDIVVKGGSVLSEAAFLRGASREADFYDLPGAGTHGFRCARSLP